jgi:DNA primase
MIYNANMNRNAVEEIKSRLTIDEVIGSYIKIEKAGKAYKAKCPFHNEKTASFFISPDRGGYYCFGCGAKGDMFSFVEQFEGLDFKGALKVLADRAGVEIRFESKNANDSEKDKLFGLMEDATKYYESELNKSAEAKNYLLKRGLKEQTIKDFRIGFAPQGWRNLHDHLLYKKYPVSLLDKAGLIKKAEEKKDSFYDRFRGRVMFPIADSSGRIIAFSGRILVDDGKSAKYINSPETPLFDKSGVMFGLDRAKSYIRRQDYSILVEGQMDLIMSHQAGVRNTVASSGTALTDSTVTRDGIVNNLGVVRRLSKNIIIAFDSDSAGRKAAMRAAGIALSIGMDVKIAEITGGKDPADLVLNDPEEWKNTLRKAMPVIEFELNNVLRDTKDKRQLSKSIYDRVYPYVAVLDGQTIKAYYVRMISEKIHVSENAVWDDLKAVEKKIHAENTGSTNGRDNGTGSPANKVSRLDLIERRLFGFLEILRNDDKVSYDEYIDKVKKIADSKFDEIKSKTDNILSELVFEAEVFYGTQKNNRKYIMDELILAFEEDMVNVELLATMVELREMEKQGNNDKVAELAKKCQILSMRKADIAKLKH